MFWNIIGYVLVAVIAYCVIGFFLGFIGLIYGCFLPNLNPPAQKVIIVHENNNINENDT